MASRLHANACGVLIFVEQVILFVCDGAKPNQQFFNGMDLKNEGKEEVVYMMKNRYNPDKHIYSISDVPHLIATCNCWYSFKTWRSAFYVSKLCVHYSIT